MTSLHLTQYLEHLNVTIRGDIDSEKVKSRFIFPTPYSGACLIFLVCRGIVLCDTSTAV